MITFRDFMESSLYDPQGGFYSRRTPTEDFYTAPELHPAFATALAENICKRLTALAAAEPQSPLFIMEMGSGNGTLAHQVLTAIGERQPHWLNRIRMILVERVEHLMMESILKLQNTGVRVLGYTQLEEIPPFRGVIYSNELLDAMPVHVLEKKDGRVRELYIRPEQKQKKERLETQLGLLSSRALVHAARAVRPTLEEGERHAVNLEARRWVRKIAKLLEVGSLITIDYGKRFAPGTPNPPRTFFRHTVGDDIAARPGSQDLTASVDFSQIIADGERYGLHQASYSTLATFLIDNGIMDKIPAGSDIASFKERSRIKTLFHPEGMGETFKVLIQEKNSRHAA